MITKIGASASVTGADITVAKADITGMKVIAQAEAKQVLLYSKEILQLLISLK